MAGKTKIYNTTSSRALVLNSNNEIATSNTSEAQIGYLSTLTSDAQTQINGKVNKNPSILALGNFPVNSVIGTAAATVDTHNVAGITQTTAGITFTLPIPTSGLPQYFTVYNYSTSTQTIQGYSTVIGIGSFAQFFYDGSDWRVSASGGSGGNIDNVLSYANLAAFPLVGGANIIYIAEDTNFLYRWSGISYIQVGGGSGATNLGVANITGTSLDITSDTGTDATIPQATITQAGLLNATDKVKLNNALSKAGDTMSGNLQIANTSPEIGLNETDTLTNFRVIVLAGTSYLQGNNMLFTGYSGVDLTSLQARFAGINRDILHSGSSIPITQFANAVAGSLISFNSSGVASYIPPGTLGQVLTTQGAGAAPIWQTPSGSGGSSTKNYIKNGNFLHTPFGTSLIIDTSGVQRTIASLWQVRRSTLSPVNVTTSVSVISGIRYMYSKRTAGDASVANWGIYQTIEPTDVQNLAGQQATLAFEAYHGANWSSLTPMVVRVYSSTVADDTSAKPTGYTAGTLVATYTLPSINTTTASFTMPTFTVPANAQSLLVSFNQDTPVGTAGADDGFSLGKVRLGKGSTAPSFEEQSYVDIENDISSQLTVLYANIGLQGIKGFQSIVMDGTTTAKVTLSYPLKRKTPAITFRLSTILTIVRNGVDATSTAIAQSAVTADNVNLSITIAAGTAGDAASVVFRAAGDYCLIEALGVSIGT